MITTDSYEPLTMKIQACLKNRIGSSFLNWGGRPPPSLVKEDHIDCSQLSNFPENTGETVDATGSSSNCVPITGVVSDLQFEVSKSLED